MCLSVLVGSFDDPADLQGLAHYTEHVVLMGNEEYPTVNEFDEYVDRRCGWTNACTEFELTNYEAVIPNEYLDGCLQRFAACFKKPLFREDDLNREINPVHSEFMGAFMDDDVRIEQLICSLAKENSPMNLFSWGNQESLANLPKKKGVNVREQMVAFFHQFYKAEAMRLAIQSQESLDHMETLVRRHFSTIPSAQDMPEELRAHIAKRLSHTPMATYAVRVNEQSSYDKDAFTRIHYVEPVEEGHHLKMVWPCPPQTALYKCKPLSYLGVLLGHEGAGSIISFLRKKALGLELVAGVDESSFDQNTHNAMFSLKIQLTDSGLQQIGDVIAILKYYLGYLQRQGPQKWHFEEEMRIALTTFRYKNEANANKNVNELARNLHMYPLEDIIIGQTLSWEYMEDEIRAMLAHLTLGNCLFFIQSRQAFEAVQAEPLKEKWCDLKYKVMPLPKVFECQSILKQELESLLYFPKPNQFICTNFDILPSEPRFFDPDVLIEDKISKLFFARDLEFFQPKGYISFLFTSIKPREEARYAANAELFVNIFNNTMMEEIYPALMTGLEYNIKDTVSGLLITFRGYNEKLHDFVHFVMDKFVNLEVDEQTYEMHKMDLLRSYYNAAQDNEHLVDNLTRSTLLEGSYCSLELRRQLFELTLSDLKSLMAKLLETAYIQCFSYGNLTRQNCISTFNYVRSLINSNQKFIRFEDARRLGMRRLRQGENYIMYRAFNSTDENIMIANTYLLEMLDLRKWLILTLFIQEMTDPLFNTLRNKEHLAYLVYAKSAWMCEMGTFVIKMRCLASEYSPSFVDKRIDRFLDEFSNHIAALTEEKFEQLKMAKLKELLVRPLNMQEQFNEYMEQVHAFKYIWDIHLRRLRTLEKVTLEDFRGCAYHWLSTINRNKLSVISVGKGEAAVRDVRMSEMFLLKTFTKDNGVQIKYNQKWTFYDQVDGNPDDIVYSLVHVQPNDTDPNAFYITDHSYFTEHCELHPHTIRPMRPKHMQHI